MIVENRYISFPDMHDGGALENSIDRLARVLVDERRKQIAQLNAQLKTWIQCLIYTELDNYECKVKRIMFDLLNEKGYEISIDELDSIFDDHTSISIGGVGRNG